MSTIDFKKFQREFQKDQRETWNRFKNSLKKLNSKCNENLQWFCNTCFTGRDLKELIVRVTQGNTPEIHCNTCIDQLWEEIEKERVQRFIIRYFNIEIYYD